jgi:hypothetical protein
MPPPLYSMKPKSLNRFRKKLTRERVVPIISASVSWLIFAIIGRGLDYCGLLRMVAETLRRLSVTPPTIN